MSSSNQSFLNTSRNSNRSLLFSNRQDDSMASRQSRENSLISTSRYKSPFYEGKVSFGGSSAKRVRLSQVLPYNLASKPSTITRIKESEIKRSTEFDQLSSASRSMLENIYKTSSPLEDAKKIPIFTPNQNSLSSYLIDVNAKPYKRISNLRTPKLISNIKTSSPVDREKLQLKWEENVNTINKTVNINKNNQLFNASKNNNEIYSSNTFSATTTNNTLKRPLISITQEDNDFEEEFKLLLQKQLN